MSLLYDFDSMQIATFSILSALLFPAQTLSPKNTPGKKFLIVEHTDNVGDFGTNQTLSRDRAAAVTEALASGHGVPRSAMVSVGIGMAAPAASNSDEAGRAKNRRVEIVEM